MRRLATVRNTLRSLFQRRQVEADLELELRQHLEQEIESNIGAGMSPDQARLAALRLIGPMPLHREECRDWRGTALIENLRSRCALRAPNVPAHASFHCRGGTHFDARHRREHRSVHFRGEYAAAPASGSRSAGAGFSELGRNGEYRLSELRRLARPEPSIFGPDGISIQPAQHERSAAGELSGLGL